MGLNDVLSKIDEQDDGPSHYLHATVLGKEYWRGYQTPPHIMELEEKMEAYVIDKTLKAPIMVLNYPPRHGKTLYVQNFIAWYLGEHPDDRVAYLSHSHKIAEEKGMEIKDIFVAMYPDKPLRHDSKSKSNFRLKNFKGGLYSTGIDGSITGKGFQLIVVDDPHSGEAGVQSTAKREAVLSTFDRTIRTRLEPDGSVILIQTRWHPSDLTGHLMEKHGDKLLHMNYPAISAEGKPLWEERWNLDSLNAIKFDVGGAAWAAQFMQQPYLEGGQEFKWDWLVPISEYIPHEHRSASILAFDPAISEKESADNSVLVYAASDNRTGHIQIQDIWYGKWNFNRQIEELILKDSQLSPDVVLVEEVAYQKALRDYLLANTNVYVKPVNHGRISKETRIRTSLIPPVENGQVQFAEHILEDKEFADEYLQFPKSRRDDIIDAISMAVSYLKKNGGQNPYTQAYGPGSYYEFSSGAQKKSGERPALHNPYSQSHTSDGRRRRGMYGF